MRISDWSSDVCSSDLSVRAFRQRDAATPVVLMGYLNPIEVRGADGFAREATDAGVDGVLLVDLPPEEADGFREAFAAHGLALVLLASPTTTPERLETLCSQVQGYLYYVSLAGVTGSSEVPPSELQSLIRISF